ncbi:MAG: hypothetical protein KC420_06995, partial [Myxococcales bacterium]|nr:hypothetical protein [Myxococcales bacterium]
MLPLCVSRALGGREPILETASAATQTRQQAPGAFDSLDELRARVADLGDELKNRRPPQLREQELVQPRLDVEVAARVASLATEGLRSPGGKISGKTSAAWVLRPPT